MAASRDVEDAKRQSAEAEGDLEQARAQSTPRLALSDRAIVRAPFAGVVAQRFHNPGDLVEAAASDPVLSVIDPSRLQVVAAVPAAEFSRIAVGHYAECVGGSQASRSRQGADAGAQVDPAPATGHVRLAFSKPTTLTAGMSVQVGMVAEARPQALTIPVARW